MSSVKPIPDGFTTVTPHLVARDVVKAIAFYEKAFGAERGGIMFMPDGKTVMHAQIRIGNSNLMMAEESAQYGSLSPLTLGNSPVVLHLYVKDVDATFKQAVAAGATVKMPPIDMFWGDRYAQVVDPFGHKWSIATHTKDLTPEQMGKAAEEAMAQMAAGGKPKS
jgi:PhnB protein